LGNLPLAVISHGEPIDETPAGMPPGQFEEQRQTADQRLAKLSSNSELVIAKRSSHNVELSQPGLIVDEINLLVPAVREQTCAAEPKPRDSRIEIRPPFASSARSAFW
jgi:hypothetical protein